MIEYDYDQIWLQASQAVGRLRREVKKLWRFFPGGGWATVVQAVTKHDGDQHSVFTIFCGVVRKIPATDRTYS